ncbi:MAG TPA: pyridoxal-phosphate dependent enzyme [Steroidobacteraceae bacterium]|jgi:threonine dehydratase|nr:pyridoxal-phosphate dependent enzyme [Steroidobacteraceae bacterium]
MALTLSLIREAHARIKDKINRTPVLTSATLDAAAGARIFFKCENFQKVGAFKARGATNAVFVLSDEEARRGVATHSSGNHAAALARAARLRSIPAHIVMPNNAPAAKRAAVARYGGRIVFCEPTLEARESTCARVLAATGATLIHPYDDLRVMAGQGTTALEMLEEFPELDCLVCPVGGGGQLAGIAVAAKSMKPGIRVVGVEPAAADDACRSFRAGHIIPSVNPQTIADGLRSSLGTLPFAEIQRYVDEIVTVSEESIVRSMRTIWEVMKIIVEPSAAVPYAALLEDKLNVAGQRVGIVLSGGNLDLDALPWMKSHA